MSDSVPSLGELMGQCVKYCAHDVPRQEIESAIFTYSRHHDPAWKAAREGSAAWESTEFRTSTRTLRLCRE